MTSKELDVAGEVFEALKDTSLSRLSVHKPSKNEEVNRHPFESDDKIANWDYLSVEKNVIIDLDHGGLSLDELECMVQSAQHVCRTIEALGGH